MTALERIKEIDLKWNDPETKYIFGSNHSPIDFKKAIILHLQNVIFLLRAFNVMLEIANSMADYGTVNPEKEFEERMKDAHS